MGENDWDLIIDAEDKAGRSSLQKIWQYRDLLWLLVRRDFVAFYKQTILGPVWFFIRPVVASIVYFFIFGQVAGISTDGLPPALFYMSGLMIWGYFTETVGQCGGVLIQNAGIFGKVYFPRLIMPLSIVFSNMLRLATQLILLIVLYIYFLFTNEAITLSPAILLVPLIIAIVSMQAIGLGVLVAAVATKYRDFSMLLGYVLQLGLFLTPVIFPLTTLSGKFKLLVTLNPMTIPVELFRFAFFGTGSFELWNILFMLFSTLLIFSVGIFAFNRFEKTFVDTI